MNPRIKQLWINALRSGSYQQGRGRLRGEDGFCCLGVLCDLHPRSKLEWKQRDGNWSYLGDHVHYPPRKIWEWASALDCKGMPTRGPADEVELAKMNDRGASFNDIADFIEQRF